MSKKSLLIPIASIGVILLVALGMLLFGGSHEANSRTTPLSIVSVADNDITNDAELSGIRSLSAAFIKVAEKVNPAVVNVNTKSTVKTSRGGRPGSDEESDPFRDFFGDDFFRRFFQEPQSRTRRSLGSGVIISEDGYILTNNHVVEKADEIKVALDDKKEYSAKVIGADKDTDVAVIKIDAHGLVAAKLGDSDKLQVGELVLAIGNPLRLSHTVTHGIISAVGRSNVGLATYEDFIQTDASINPGNSGGPLVNINGEVIGINTAIATNGAPGNIGIGFAIPINMAREVMEQLTNKGKVTRGWLGIQLQDIDSDLAEKYGLKEPHGVLVVTVFEDGPAGKAGLKSGDLIVEFDGKIVEDGALLRKLVAMAGPDKKVKVKVIRDKKEKEFDVKLSERTDEVLAKSSGEQTPSEDAEQWMGLSVQELTDELSQRLGYKGQSGVLITDVDPESPAAKVEDPPMKGDLIQEIEYKEIKNIKDYKEAVKEVEGQNRILVRLRRANRGPWYVLFKK